MPLFNCTSELVWLALNRSLAIVESGMDRSVLDANQNFCQLIGYLQSTQRYCLEALGGLLPDSRKIQFGIIR